MDRSWLLYVGLATAVFVVIIASGSVAGAAELRGDGHTGHAVSSQSELAPAMQQQQGTLEIVETRLSKEQINPGESVTLRATISNTGEEAQLYNGTLRIDGEAVQTKMVNVGDGSTAPLTFTWTASSPGEYNVSINGVEVGTVTVTSQVSIWTTQGTGEVNIDVWNATTRSDLVVDLSRVRTVNRTEPVALSSMTIEVARPVDQFETSAWPPSSNPGTTPAPTVGDPIQYVRLASTLDEDEDVASASITLTVNETALPEGRSPESVEVYQYTDDEWVPLNTTWDAESDEYTAELQDLSMLAVVSTEAGQVQIVETRQLPDWVRPGTTTELRVVVENPGERPATRNVSVSIDGERVGTEAITLAPGERTTVGIPFEAESGTVSVDGTEVGQLNATLESGNQNRGGSDAVPTLSGDGMWFVLVACVVTVLLCLGGGSVYAIKRRASDEGKL